MLLNEENQAEKCFMVQGSRLLFNSCVYILAEGVSVRHCSVLLIKLEFRSVTYRNRCNYILKK